MKGILVAVCRTNRKLCLPIWTVCCLVCSSTSNSRHGQEPYHFIINFRW